MRDMDMRGGRGVRDELLWAGQPVPPMRGVLGLLHWPKGGQFC